MVSFPNAKINLGLRVLRKRADGYHDLSTIFFPLPVKDVLEIVPATTTTITTYGIPIPAPAATLATPPSPSAPAGDNLCTKAWHLLKKDFPSLPPVHIHLYKNIPIGAGLGGGSADGAFTLTTLNQQFGLNLDTPALLRYAAILGSDCPFFILNTPCLGSGRGEQLTPITLDLAAYSFILVNPGIHISTAQAFAGCRPNADITPLEDIIHQPVHTWQGQLINDFETPVFQLHPALREIKETLYAHGAGYASLTGSGSSLFGIFEKHRLPRSLPLSHNYRILP